jgi:hypothetical protein
MLGTQERFAPLPVICLITLTAVAWTRQSRREAEGGSDSGTTDQKVMGQQVYRFRS